MDEWASLSAVLDENWTFDSIFTFDAALGKYVYTAQGYMEAL